MDEREAQIALFKKRKKIANISFLLIMVILIILFVLYEWRRLPALSENNSAATESSLGTIVYEKNPKPKGVSAELSQSFGELLEKIEAINWTTESIIASSTATTTIATTTATTTDKK